MTNTHQREAVERVVARLNSFTTCGCSDDDWPQLRYDAVHLIDNLAKQTSEEPTEVTEAMKRAGAFAAAAYGHPNLYHPNGEMLEEIYLAMRSQQSGNSHDRDA